MSILVNTTAKEKNTLLLNTYTDATIFNNTIIQYKNILEKDAEIYPIDERYHLRPDKLAYDIWGQDLWYPAILAINNLGSILQFKPESLGYNCKIPSTDNMLKVLTIINSKK